MFPPASMVTVQQYREAARAHRSRASRMIRLVEQHPPGCDCEKASIEMAAWLLESMQRVYG